MTKLIPLTQGQQAIVDDEDYDFLMQWKWYFVNVGYAARKPWKSGQILMHRVIMNAPAGMQVDHINQNKLDNRRCNLRLATPGENKRNRPKTKHFSRSQYKGVSLDPRSGRYHAHITVDWKCISLGGYGSEIDAAKAYDVAAVKYHGEFAYLNFPMEDRNA